MSPTTAPVMRLARPVQFFIPGHVAEIALTEMALLRQAPRGTATPALERRSPTVRFSYRFSYRLTRGNAEYRCRITASTVMVDVLVARLHVLASRAEFMGDRALLDAALLGIATAMNAIAGTAAA